MGWRTDQGLHFAGKERAGRLKHELREHGQVDSLKGLTFLDIGGGSALPGLAARRLAQRYVHLIAIIDLLESEKGAA